MRRNMLARLGDVIELHGGVRLVVSDLDVPEHSWEGHREWVKLCPLVPTADPDVVLRSLRDYENSFEVMITIDKYGANLESINAPFEYLPELTSFFLENHRIPAMLRACLPYQERLRAEANGVELSLADGWL